MVKARQMKDAMQRQNPDLLGSRMTEPDSVLQSNDGRDGDFASQLCGLVRFRGGPSKRKRQHVRGLVLAAKLAVQGTHDSAAGHQDVHLAAEARGSPRSQHEALEGLFGQSRDFFLKNNQPARLRCNG